MICNLCPRKCNAERNDSIGKGYCKMPKSLYVSRVAHHYWEEPVISGKKGTVAVFFTGCTLDCIYCQNREISHSNLGRKVTINELAKEVTLLLDKGSESLSFITPSHYTNGIIQLLDIISPKVPVVYNTSGFDSIETLKKLEGYIDIYLPDFKYSNNDLGLEYSNVRNYFDVTSKAIEEMVRQTGEPVINQDGIMEKGTIFKFHNDLDTDQIIASQYLLLPNLDEMKGHAFESLDPDFAKKVKPGDFVVGGENFGCGSSREQAPGVLKALGVQAVIAKSFARIFFRNAINIGLPAIVCKDLPDAVEDGDTMVLHMSEGTAEVNGKTYT